jgi:glycosyltransferase involved in cell wall biosynthesis
VPAHHPEQAVSDLSTAMVRLATDPHLCSQMGLAGQQRVRESYAWEVKGKQLAQVYKEIAVGKLLNHQ